MTLSAATGSLMRVVEAALTQRVATALAKAMPPGTPVEGRILQSAKGQMLVEVAGRSLALHLPGQWTVGERLQLLYLGGAVRPAFLLTGTAPHPVTDHLVLSNVAQSLLDLPRSAETGGIRGLRPLLAGPPIAGGQIAQTLQQSVTQSGLFYESHLVAWVQGKIPLQNLQGEPQNAALPRVVPKGLSTPHEVTTPPSATNQAPARILPDRATGAMTYMQIAELGKTVANHALVQPSADLASLVGRQVQVLNQQQITWSGPVWPGQCMQWTVSRREERARDHARPPAMAMEAVAPHWDSTLTLHMPHLGNIQAKLRLHQDILSLSIKADQVAPLRAHWKDLETALQALGLCIRQHEIREYDGE